MPPILVYEHNRAYVIQQSHNGHFDYIDVVQEMAQRDFLRFVASTLLLERLASSYPWPRDKEEVPRRFYISPPWRGRGWVLLFPLPPARTIDNPAVPCTLGNTGADAAAARLSVKEPEWTGRTYRIVLHEED